MRHGIVAAILVLGLAASIGAEPTTQPQALSPSSSLDNILDALDARGRDLSDFSAVVTLTDTDNTTGDVTIHSGTAIFQRQPGGDARIRVKFNKKQNGEKIFQENHEYILDAGWLIERDYQTKKEIRRQVVRPGQKIDPLKLGEGPFPLPIGQNKADVYKLFDVKKIDPAKDDPAGTVHVRLAPHHDTEFARKFETIDVWVDDADHMPRRIQTVDPNESTQRTTDLTDVKINVGLGDKDFQAEALPDGWDTITEPYGQP